MQNRKTLEQFLKNYYRHAGLRMSFFRLPWIKELSSFIKNLKSEGSITPPEKEILVAIINSRDRNHIQSDSQLSVSEDLARKIINLLSIPILDENIKADFDLTILVKIFNYLRPEEIAQLMCLSKEFNRELRNPLIWREAVSSHFTLNFSKHKYNPNINCFDLFKQFHQEYYQGLTKREKQLFSSVKSGDILTLNALDMNFEDLYHLDKHERPLMIFAAGNLSQSFRNHIYQTLILPFYLTHSEDKLGFTHLHRAAAFSQLETMKELLANGANVNAVNTNGTTPLLMAANDGHLDVVSELIANGANVSTSDNVGNTPLILAAYYGHFDILRELLANGANVNTADNSGITPLWIAAKNGHTKVVRELIVNGANVNTADNSGITPLWIAAQNGHTKVVRELIVNGANLDAARNNGITPLWMAARNGYTKVVRVLIANGANVSAAHNDGRTPLWIAAQNGHVDVIRELIANSANVSTADSDGITPLDVAAKNGHTEVIKTLSRAKLDTVIDEISNSPVSNHPATLFSKLLSKQYSRDEKLAAAVALKLAVDSGDMSLLNEYREIAENTAELAPLYRNLQK